MITWPNELVEDIARRKSVLFLGAGISKNAINAEGERPPDWKEFLRFLASRASGDERDVVERYAEIGDLLTACEVARRALRGDVFQGCLLSEFSEKRFQFGKVHEDIVRIDSRIVITTNFDKIYENAATSILHGDFVVKTYKNDDTADALRRQNRCVLKVHGSIDSPGDAILTRSDYVKARVEFSNFYRLLDALFMTHTFVFLGASLNDPDVRLLLEDYARRYPGTRPHYVVSPKGSMPRLVERVIEETMNLRMIDYDPSDHHRELMDGVADLKQLVEDARSSLLETMNW